MTQATDKHGQALSYSQALDWLETGKIGNTVKAC